MAARCKPAATSSSTCPSECGRRFATATEQRRPRTADPRGDTSPRSVSSLSIRTPARFPGSIHRGRAPSAARLEAEGADAQTEAAVIVSAQFAGSKRPARKPDPMVARLDREAQRVLVVGGLHASAVDRDERPWVGALERTELQTGHLGCVAGNGHAEQGKRVGPAERSFALRPLDGMEADRPPGQLAAEVDLSGRWPRRSRPRPCALQTFEPAQPAGPAPE